MYKIKESGECMWLKLSLSVFEELLSDWSISCLLSISLFSTLPAAESTLIPNFFSQLSYDRIVVYKTIELIIFIMKLFSK
jgi:hypothetical protein